MFDLENSVLERKKALAANSVKKICFRKTPKIAVIVISLFICGPFIRLSWGAQPSHSPVNVNISNITLGRANKAGQFRMVTFDIHWDDSWRTKNPPSNWDAAWVFMKYQVGGGEWSHATLSTISAEHKPPSGTSVTPPSDGKGVFIHRSGDGTGPFQASNVSLRWNYGLDHVADDDVVHIKVLGLVMVYVPEGGFFAGDNGASNAALTKGSKDNRPWFIASEDAIEVTNTTSDGYFYVSSKDFWNEKWNASEDATSSQFTIPAGFPKGFRAIYCMKYELTQQQYVDFLNTLTRTQVVHRYDRANYNKFGYTILETDGVYSTTHPDRACGFISPADGLAYADWAGLRPMTELEFEKICRGSGQPAVNLEFAWGTTYSKNAVLATGTENDREYVTSAGANSYYLDDRFQARFPLNSGIFGKPGKSRELSGSAYYGVMDMSTNLSEFCVAIGNKFGRVFTFRNGNGRLAPDGFADESGWPLRDGKGGGFRGGCFANERFHMSISVRIEASVEIDWTHRHIPWGFRGVRTVFF